MKSATKIVSLVSLLASVVPSVLYFGGLMGHEAVKAIALVGTIAWFVATPMWMGRE